MNSENKGFNPNESESNEVNIQEQYSNEEWYQSLNKEDQDNIDERINAKLKESEDSIKVFNEIAIKRMILDWAISFNEQVQLENIVSDENLSSEEKINRLKKLISESYQGVY